MSNQAILGSGCVCDSGCEACGRLAEAFGAMREALRGTLGWMDTNGNRQGEARCPWSFAETMRAALILARIDVDDSNAAR